MRNYWLQAGGDSAHADIMAHVAMAESGGDPNATGKPYVENGKTYHAHGLWQISDVHGAGNWNDPITNAKKAVELFAAQGFGPWENSRNSGGGGGWGQYLAHALVRGMAAATPHHEVPLPPGGFAAALRGGAQYKPADFGLPAAPDLYSSPGPWGTTLVTTQQNARKKNADATLARHNVLDEIAGHQDIMYALVQATQMDSILKTGTKHRDQALHLWMTDPGAMEDMYGYNSKPYLEAMAAHGADWEKVQAKYELAHPLAAGADTFVAEFINPVSWAEGLGAGKVLGLGRGLLAQAPMGRRLLTFASPYREIVARHGYNARNLIAQMGQNVTHGGERAMQETIKHFGGLTLDAQQEVVHISQGGASAATHLAQRAAAMRQNIVEMTRAKLAALAMETKNVFDVTKFFPMRGAYDHPIYNDQTMSFLDQLRTEVKGASAAGASTMHKVFATLADTRLSPLFDPSKFVPAENYYKYLKAGYANIAFEDGLRKIAKAHPDMIRQVQAIDYGLTHLPWVQNATETAQQALERTLAENHAHWPIGHPERLELRPPVDAFGRQMIQATQTLGEVASPFLKNAWLSPEFADFLGRKGGAATMTGIRVVDDAFVSTGMKIMDRYNGAFRATIMTNPFYHPFWNIATNTAAAARDGMANMMKHYARAAIGTAFSIPDMIKLLGFKGAGDYLGAGRDVIERRFWTGAQTYARDMLAAQRGGANAELGAGVTALGGDAAKIRTLASSSLGPVEKLDKFLTGITDWNKEATFGPRAEQAFSSYLFKKFTDAKGAYRMAEEDAAWAVREALGNYQNVNPNAMQSKFMFFYPWLKTNVPFWLKTFITAPRYAMAPMLASKRASQLADDPRAEDPRYERAPNQTYLGTSAAGEQVAYTAPLPMKDAAKVVNIFDPRPPSMGGPDMAERTGDVAQIVQSRLMPLVGTALSIEQTAIGKPAEPGTYQGFDTMYNKDAPGDVQARELAMSTAAKVIPQLAPFLSQDIEKSGFHADRIGDYAIEMASMGFISRTEGDAIKRQESRALLKYEAQKKRLDKRMGGSSPMSFSEYQKKLTKDYEAYQARAALIRKRLSDKLTGSSAPPKTYAPSDFGTPPPGGYSPSDFGPPK
jgi:hypothetical protein